MDIGYERHCFPANEIIIQTVVFVVCVSTIAYLFYDSFIAFAIMVVLYPIFITIQKRKHLQQIKEELKKQFCEMIASVSTSLNAGFSIENSFRESIKDMDKLYGSKSYIVIELSEIIKKLDIGVPLSTCLLEFSQRAEIEDISDFITVFLEATRSGGNLNEIIKSTVSIIQEKRYMEEEIEAMLKGKMLEQKVVSVIPLLIFVYLRFSNGSFMNVLYHNALGICIMTVCLLVYIGSLIMAAKIVKIKV